MLAGQRFGRPGDEGAVLDQRLGAHRCLLARLTVRKLDDTLASSMRCHTEETMTATVEELAPRTEDEVRAHLAAGKLVEGCSTCPRVPEGDPAHPHRLGRHRAGLRARLPARGRARAGLNDFGSAVSIIQDELAHAHIGYRLLEDLGVDMPALIYERAAAEFKYPYAFDLALDSWAELVVANALYDQAARAAVDVHRHSTFGPWKRALAKVDKEETFHLRHGRSGSRSSPPTRTRRPSSRPRWTGCSC